MPLPLPRFSGYACPPAAPVFAAAGAGLTNVNRTMADTIASGVSAGVAEAIKPLVPAVEALATPAWAAWLRAVVSSGVSVLGGAMCSVVGWWAGRWWQRRDEEKKRKEEEEGGEAAVAPAVPVGGGRASGRSSLARARSASSVARRTRATRLCDEAGGGGARLHE